MNGVNGQSRTAAAGAGLGLGVLSAISDGVVVLDRSWRFTACNDAGGRFLDRAPEYLIGRSMWEEFPGSLGSPFEQRYRQAVESGRPVLFEEFYAPLDRWFEVRAFPDPDGLTLFFRDVHERHKLQDAQAEYAALSDAVLQALPAPTLLLDWQGTVLRVNAAWSAAGPLGGVDPSACQVGDDAYAAMRAAVAAGHDSAAVILEGVLSVAEGTATRFVHDHAVSWAQGVHWFRLQVTPIAGERGVVVSHLDITDRVLAQQHAAQQARLDILTDLPNRMRLHEIIDQALRRAAADVTLLFLDLDGFKDVNDSLGHDVGDQLLQDLSRRLLSCMRPGDVVGRLGGDEFVVVAVECELAAAVQIADRIRNVVAEPFEVAGMHLPLTASVGIATSDPTHRRAQDLVRDADAAMYAAKDGGRDRHHVFTPELRDQARTRIEMVSGLRSAIRSSEFVLHYQPIVDLTTHDVVSVEALVRWQHPRRGLLAPGTFIPLAEETGLVVPLGRWVVGEALRQSRSWAAAGRPGSVAVNLAAAHLHTGSLVDDVVESLDLYAVPPTDLVLEVTETSVVADLPTAARQLDELRRLGVTVAIDDFGSGWSSLGQLRDLPADFLKIDRALLPGSTGRVDDPAALTLLRTVIALGKAFGMRTVAEGVETEEQLNTVIELGCDRAQGYLLGRPGSP